MNDGGREGGRERHKKKKKEKEEIMTVFLFIDLKS
jgi:hypothetical protein